MNQQFEFGLVFELPDANSDPCELSDAIFEAGFEDAIIGTGNPRLLSVELELEGDDAKKVILGAAQKIMKGLPKGTRFREASPDLVTLAEVAEKLNIQRQSLQKREKMPLPTVGGLYRITEISEALLSISQPETGKRTPRFDINVIHKWLSAGAAAREVNALLTMEKINPISVELLYQK